MTDDYESRLRARLGALEGAVPVSSEAAWAGQTIHRGTRVRSALPVGSLVAAGLVVMVVVGLVPRLAPASVGASPSGAPSESAPVWNPGAMMLPQLAPNGAGYTYVDGTGLFVTADYGATWSGPHQIPAGDSPQDHLWDMGTLDFADGQHGWMTGVTNGVTGSTVSEYRTGDGGQTWKSVPITTFTEAAQPAGTEGNWVFATQHFVDALHGRLQVGRRAGAQEPSACAEWVTADGGVSWAQTKDVPCFASPKWVTPTLGYGRSGAGESIWVTQDGGVSWRSGELPGKWSTYSPSLLAQESNGTLTLVVASGSSSTQPPMAVMASDDGGTSWRLSYEVDPAKQTQALVVFDGLALASPVRWTLLAGNSLWESRDGGLTWSKVGNHRFNYPQGMAWWDEQHGAMLDGGVLVTSDGGQTWRQVNFQPGRPPLSGPSAAAASTETPSPSASNAAASPSASLVLASPMAPVRPSSISKIDWTTVPLPDGVTVDTTTGNITAHAEPVVAGFGGDLVMLAMAGVYSLDLTTDKWTKLAGPEAFGGYVPLSGLIDDGRGGLMAWGSEGIFGSRDGRTWQKTLPTDPDGNQIYHLTVTPTGFLAVGDGSDGRSAVAFTSADGTLWTRQNLPDAANWDPTQAFVWNGKLAIGAAWVDPNGEEGKVPLRPTRVWLSSDGTSWETRSVLTGFVLPRFLSLGDVTVAYEGISGPYNKGVPVSYYNPRQSPVSSTNLTDWHRVTVTPATGFTSGVVDIEPFGSGLMAANSDGSVMTSGDGVSWKLQSSSGPSGWLKEASLETLSNVGDSLVYTNAKLPSGKPGLLIVTPVE